MGGEHTSNTHPHLVSLSWAFLQSHSQTLPQGWQTWSHWFEVMEFTYPPPLIKSHVSAIISLFLYLISKTTFNNSDSMIVTPVSTTGIWRFFWNGECINDCARYIKQSNITTVPMFSSRMKSKISLSAIHGSQICHMSQICSLHRWL